MIIEGVNHSLEISGNIEQSLVALAKFILRMQNFLIK